jgi:hypothetical protein
MCRGEESAKTLVGGDDIEREWSVHRRDTWTKRLDTDIAVLSRNNTRNNPVNLSVSFTPTSIPDAQDGSTVVQEDGKDKVQGTIKDGQPTFHFIHLGTQQS